MTYYTTRMLTTYIAEGLDGSPVPDGRLDFTLDIRKLTSKGGFAR